jgi:hypothetical protein
VDPGGSDGDIFATADNDYRLRAASPAVDAGRRGALPGTVGVDVAGRPRFADGNGDGTREIDLGAHERAPAFALRTIGKLPLP